jgi:hypothetical protein
MGVSFFNCQGSEMIVRGERSQEPLVPSKGRGGLTRPLEPRFVLGWRVIGPLAAAGSSFHFVSRLRIDCNSCQRLAFVLGQVILSPSNESRTIWDTISQAFCLSSAGTTYQNVADESTGNLDSTNGAAIMDFLFDLHHTRGATLVLVTHHAGHADRCARRIQIKDRQVFEQSSVQAHEVAS